MGSGFQPGQLCYRCWHSGFSARVSIRRCIPSSPITFVSKDIFKLLYSQVTGCRARRCKFDVHSGSGIGAGNDEHTHQKGNCTSITRIPEPGKPPKTLIFSTPRADSAHIHIHPRASQRVTMPFRSEVRWDQLQELCSHVP